MSWRKWEWMIERDKGWMYAAMETDNYTMGSKGKTVDRVGSWRNAE